MVLSDEELTPFRIVLGHEAVARLMELCEEAHCEPAQMIAALVTDVLRDDFEAHHEPAGYSSEKPLH